MATSGLYTHVTRAAGTIVTAPLYNTAHQNHLINDVPNEAGAVGATLAEFRATEDPAPLGVVNMVAAIADELEQLRFELADIKTALQGGTPPAQWYTPVTVTASAAPAKGARVFRNASQSIAQSTNVACIFDTERYDTGINGSFTDTFWVVGQPTRLTAKAAGLYEINGFVQWNVGAGGDVIVAIRLNGGPKLLAASEWTTDGTAVPWLAVATQYELALNDYVELVVFQNISNPFTIINPEFGLELLSPTAVITPPPHQTLTITESGGGTGVVTSNVGPINCPGVCAASYVQNTVVQLTATPDNGSTFIAWTGVPAGHETDNPVSVTMSTDKTVNAEYEIIGMLAGFGPTSVIGSTGTFFIAPSVKMGDTQSTDAAVAATVPTPITLLSLTITLSAAIAASSQLTFRYVVNGVVSNAISLVMLPANGRSAAATGTLALNANDTLSIQIDTNGVIPTTAIQAYTGRYYA